MTKTDYERAYEAAEKELGDLLTHQEHVANRILTLRQTLTSLAALCKQEDVDFEPGIGAEALIDRMGITEDILSILRAIYPATLTAMQVRDRLKDLGYDLEQRYQNPLATIYVVLNRLKDKDDAVEEKIEDGKKVYKAKGQWGAAFIPGQIDRERDAKQQGIGHRIVALAPMKPKTRKERAMEILAQARQARQKKVSK